MLGGQEGRVICPELQGNFKNLKDQVISLLKVPSYLWRYTNSDPWTLSGNSGSTGIKSQPELIKPSAVL